MKISVFGVCSVFISTAWPGRGGTGHTAKHFFSKTFLVKSCKGQDRAQKLSGTRRRNGDSQILGELKRGHHDLSGQKTLAQVGDITLPNVISQCDTLSSQQSSLSSCHPVASAGGGGCLLSCL